MIVNQVFALSLPRKSTTSSHLSAGGAAGVGVGASFGGIFVLLALIWGFWFRRRRSGNNRSGQSSMMENGQSPTTHMVQAASSSGAYIGGNSSTSRSHPSPSSEAMAIDPNHRFEHVYPQFPSGREPIYADQPAIPSPYASVSQSPSSPSFPMVGPQPRYPTPRELPVEGQMPFEVGVGPGSPGVPMLYSHNYPAEIGQGTPAGQGYQHHPS